jgi:SAM-dependent methyltransferase
VTGIDFSKRSIQYAVEEAERSGLSICYVNQNYLDFETEDRFDLILMIMCDFCALSPEQRKQILGKFYKLLNPRGYVLLDVYSLASFEQREEIAMYELNLLDGFWSPDTYYGFLNTFKYKKEKVVLDKYTRLRTVYNWLQYFDPDELIREFVESGFKVDEFFSDVSGSNFEAKAGEFAVIARKS